MAQILLFARGGKLNSNLVAPLEIVLPGRVSMPMHQTSAVPSLGVGSCRSDRIRHALISASRRWSSAS